MKLATFNVNSIRSRMHIVVPYLKEKGIDILCLQETKVSDDKFPRKEFEALGYQVFHSGGDRGRAGVAVISKQRPRDFAFGFPEGDGKDRIGIFEFDDFVLLNLYVPQGRDPKHEEFRYKLRFFERLLKFLDEKYTSEDPVIICGDLNVAPTDIDVHNPKRLKGHVCFREEVWEAFRKLLEWGLVDLFRLHHPDEPGQFTFFDYRVKDAVKRGLGWRVDHILATKPVAKRCKDCFIDIEPRLSEKPSDHTPLVAVFN